MVSERKSSQPNLTIHIQMDFHKRTEDKIFSLVQLEEGQGVTRIIWQFFKKEEKMSIQEARLCKDRRKSSKEA